jgi:hypothetical protein
MFTNPPEGGAAPYGQKTKTPPAGGSNGGYNPPSAGAPPVTQPGPDVTTTNTPTFPGIDPVLGSSGAYQQLLAFDKAASGQDLATMNQQIAEMNAYYGSDSDPLSLLGRVYQAYQDRNRVIANTLTGHGMINSGETGFQGARATLAYQQQELDARFKLQQYIEGLHLGYANAQRQRAMNEMSAQWDAVNSWINANPPVSTTAPGPDVTTDPGTPPTLGTGGTQVVYDENGNPIVVGSSNTYNPFK